MAPPRDELHDDATLILAAQAGDRRALDALLRRHHDAVYRICRRIAGNDADALDATQEALIAVVRGLPRFDGRSAFTTWLYRVSTNACLDELRRRRRRPTPTDDDALPARRPDGAPAFDDAIGTRMELDAALAALPEDFRVAVVLRDQLGLDYAEIAEVLEIPPGTVRSRIARGRSALAAALAGNQNPTDGRPTSRP